MIYGCFVLTALVIGSMPHSQIGTMERHYPSMIECLEAGFTMQEMRGRHVRQWSCKRAAECEAKE